jgi:uncharacterized membrane protein YhiD involved in acid resistance
MISLNNYLTTDIHSILLILFTVILSFILSLLIVFTYEFTTNKTEIPDGFLQSMILMSLITAIIMQSIGDSMARGFGIFGALAILRFRINISNPRNVTFIFAAMAMGISCGVYSFVNAIIGTLFFCFIGILLRFTPYARVHTVQAQLRIQTNLHMENKDMIEEIINKYCIQFENKRYKADNNLIKGKIFEAVYAVKFKDGIDIHQLLNELQLMENMKEVNINLDENTESNF